MKKAILTTLAIVVALVTVLSITGFAMAQAELRPTDAVANRLGLLIKAPAAVKAGEPIEIQVVTRPGERPVPDAEVWAVNLNTLTPDVVLAPDIASLSRVNGFLLGTTNDRGYVDPAPRIWREGRYILVAIKPNFDPGFALMSVTSRIPLDLRAPDTAKMDETITMTVTGPDGEGIYRAAIFAIPLQNTTIDDTIRNGSYDQLLEDAERYVEITDDPEAEAELRAEDPQAYERIMNMKRYLIGFTDRNGELHHAFDKTGTYLLIAAKRGYVPDFSIIRVTDRQLHLQAPDSARVNEPVTMRVSDSSGQGVYRVALFAVPLLSLTDDNSSYIDQLLKEAEAYAELLEHPNADGNLTTDDRLYNDTLNIRRYLIGFTDRNGEFTYRFPKAGPYLLIAAKCGYTPDFHIIKITKLQITPVDITPEKLKEAHLTIIE